jgi:hypothetical protein
VTSTVKIVAGSGIGAALMYMFDPAGGRRRRAETRDKATRLASRSRDVIEKAGRDLAHRATGAVASARSRFLSHTADDSVLEARVRTQLGRAVSHPRSVQVQVEDGAVTLRGPVLQSELDCLLESVSSVPGVKRVRNELEVHNQAGKVPGLQGGARRQDFELRQKSWTPGIRLFAGAAGSILAAWGIARRNPVSLAAAAAGACMVTRAVRK